MTRGHAAKQQLRRDILASRKALSVAEHGAEADALARHAASLVGARDIVCAYVPIGTEPGSTALLQALLDAGADVWIPVARRDADGVPAPLQWGDYRAGALVAAPFGLREPAPPWSPPEKLAEASAILVPALAVDRRGVRLGRGAGFYDRSLARADPTAARIAVIRDSEVLAAVPAEAHDVAMTHALTPHGGLVPLGGDGTAGEWP